MANYKMLKSIYLHSLGCDKNLVDSEIMLGLLNESGYSHATEARLADVIIVNTCGFIRESVEEGIETILEFSANKKTGNCKKLVVTGCMAQRYKDEIKKEIPEVDIILGVNEFPNIVNIINGKNSPQTDIFDEALFEKRINTMPMHVAYVKISEGCDNHCTYCTIPLIRGAYRSRAYESVLRECSYLVKNGVKEIVLVAQDTSRYGEDIYGRQRLHELLRDIAKIEDLGWVRLMYTYPERIYPELIQVISETEKICSYIDMPIQHSHDEVLKRMGRKNDYSNLLDIINNLKKADIYIRTTLIAGFPGETEEEFQQLFDFVKNIRFKHLGAFAYSREDGTPAAKMKPQIKASVKKERLEKIMALQAQIADEHSKSLIGQTLKVMVDGSTAHEEDKICYAGRSQSDAYEIDGAVFFDSQQELISGDFVYVKITKAHNYDLYGELIRGV